ncbi:MAG: 16S rRNA (guanine(966)-N(2))-methyltransferase RsmD [Gemmatimonadota bacterium]
MSLRITGGDLRGRRLAVPRGRATRPTPARVREAWFSAIAGRIPAASVLDLFAGSGALGIEALSRGAARVDFVESDRRAAAVLRRNLERLELGDRATVRLGDAFGALAAAEGSARRWDITLADPPYASGDAERVLAAFLRRPFADLLCVEHAARSSLAADGAPQVVWSRRYGDTAVTFFIGNRGD